MKRLDPLNPETTTGRTKELFNAVESKLGVVPNMMRTMGNSAAVLHSYLSLTGALEKGVLSAKQESLLHWQLLRPIAATIVLPPILTSGRN